MCPPRFAPPGVGGWVVRMLGLPVAAEVMRDRSSVPNKAVLLVIEKKTEKEKT